MAGIDQVRLLLKELGPTLELAEIHEDAGGTAWTLVTQAGGVLFLDYMADDDRLWLSAEAGTLRPEDRAELYPLMLQYNAHWRRTGGVRLALDGPEGAAVLAYDLPASGLDLASLCTIVGNFQDKLDGWREVLAGTPRPETTTSPPAAIIRG